MPSAKPSIRAGKNKSRLSAGSDNLESALKSIVSEIDPQQAQDQQQVKLTELSMINASIPIVGTRPYIFHKWSEKAKRMMREKQQSESAVRTKLPPKDPDQEATDCVNWLDESCTKPGIPATQFKAALVYACRFFSGITQVQARTAIFTEGVLSHEGDELIPITYGARVRREDPVRNQTGVADLRYRWAYFPWACIVPVKFVESVLDLQSLLALMNAAGLSGVGDQRPSSPRSASGTFGQFKVDISQDIKVIG